MISTDHADIARRFVESIGTGEIDPDCYEERFGAWTLNSGAMPGATYLAGVRMLASLFPEGLDIRALRILVQGADVAVQAASRGMLQNGVLYANDYVFLFTMTEGRISQVREYTDTKKVVDIIYPLMKAWTAVKSAHLPQSSQ